MTITRPKTLQIDLNDLLDLVAERKDKEPNYPLSKNKCQNLIEDNLCLFEAYIQLFPRATAEKKESSKKERADSIKRTAFFGLITIIKSGIKSGPENFKEALTWWASDSTEKERTMPKQEASQYSNSGHLQPQIKQSFFTSRRQSMNKSNQDLFPKIAKADPAILLARGQELIDTIQKLDNFKFLSELTMKEVVLSSTPLDNMNNNELENNDYAEISVVEQKQDSINSENIIIDLQEYDNIKPNEASPNSQRFGKT